MCSCRPSSWVSQTTHTLQMDTDLLLQKSHTEKTFQTSDLENIVLHGVVNAQVKHCISGHLEAVLWKVKQVLFNRKPCTQTLWTITSLDGIAKEDQGRKIFSSYIPEYKLENQDTALTLTLRGSEVRQQVDEAHTKTRQFLNTTTDMQIN